MSKPKKEKRKIETSTILWNKNHKPRAQLNKYIVHYPCIYIKTPEGKKKRKRNCGLTRDILINYSDTED